MSMPELPDITVYIEALEQRIVNQTIQKLKLDSPFLLRTAVPNIQEAHNEPITQVDRMGKRIIFGLPNDRWLVLHLMIAGRLHWYEKGKRVPAKKSLMTMEFDTGVLTLSEAGSKKRASLHFVEGHESLEALNPDGLEVLSATFEEFSKQLTVRNHTLKRALCSPKLFSGIGNAYSDEILHAAKLSPIAMTQKLAKEEIEQLFKATQSQLVLWTETLREQANGGFPEKVTAFREGMAVHGKYQQPCPVCATEIQRIRYASRETNYCPRCQTKGKLLADRSLSRLLKSDWPKTIEALENEK